MSNKFFSSKPSGQSETTREAAEQAGEEDTTRLNAEIPNSLHRRVKIQAASQDSSMKDVVVQALEEYLSKRPSE